MNFDRKIILEDGSEYYGFGFGDSGDKICEIVFNTSMVGYQEIISDPSYTYQAVVMTYPLIGNYGIAAEDFETEIPTIGGLIVKEYNDEPSNFRSKETLSEVMKKYGIPGIYGIDTRKLTRSLRNSDHRKVLITDILSDNKKCVRKLRRYQIPKNAVSKVSRKEVTIYFAESKKYNVVSIDCGMKENVVRCLNKRGCNVIIVPWNTPAEDIEDMNPDGIFISNGPGNPMDVQQTISTVKTLIGKYPIFGICLGHQIISLAYGGKTYKLKFGHRGGNHPVKNLETGKIEITSQNHSYAVDVESLKYTPLEITHLNVIDNTAEGLKCVRDKVIGVQYHPESSPGPQDSEYLFDRFAELMEENKNDKAY